MIIGLFLILLIFSLILIKAADMVVVAVRRISKSTHTGIFALSAIILALGTSFPELFVGITSALEGSSNLTFGLVLGSNIANISLISGFAAMLTGSVSVRGGFLKRDVGIALVAGVLPIFLVLDGGLNRVDGLILIAAYGAYASSFFRKRFNEIAQEQEKEETFIYRFMRQFNHIGGKKTRELGKMFVGIALLLFSADVIVRASTQIALLVHIPVFVIGLVMVAVGTSLPELAFSFRSLGDHEPSMFFGNILGSTIVNSTLVIGVSTLISPMTISASYQYATAAVFFAIVFIVFWLFIRSKHRLDRWEAGVLLLLYGAFVAAVLM